MGKDDRGDPLFLEVKNLTKTYGSLAALDDVSLQIRQGELICILGPSGCGKTTLLRVIAGLEEQDAGQVILQGRDISRLPVSKRGCGIVFQSYALFPNLNVAKNVAYGMKGHGDRTFVTKRVNELLQLVGLPGTEAKYPSQLSGGQQQRVALARALATDPSLLLLDEPLSALDAKVRVHLRREIRSLQKRLGITTIMVTHDQEEALTMSDRIVVMNGGKRIQVSSPQDLYRLPADTFIADFVGAMNIMKGWTLERPDALRSGDQVLRLAEPAEITSTDKVSVAIRPEDVLPADDPSEANVLEARVKDVEFCGSYYRVGLRLVNGSQETAHQLAMDLHAKAIDRYSIQEGQSLRVRLPSKQLYVFDQETARP